MSRIARRFFAVAPVVALSLLVGSCGGDGGGTDPDPLDAVASVTVSPATAQVDLGATVQLAASVRNGRNEVVTSTVTWTSSNASVASVDGSGLVTGVAPGSVTITARAAGVSGTATVESRDPNPPLAPGNVQATPVSNTEVDVTWADNSNSETGHVILREEVGPASSSGPAAASVFVEAGRVGPDVTSFRDSGLTPGTTYRYQVDACNDAGCSGGVPANQEPSTHPTLTIDTPDPLPDGMIGQAYQVDLASSGPDASWSLSAGSLPAGVELSSSGTIAGTPSEGGMFAPEVMAMGGGQMVTKVFGLTIVTPPAVVTATLPAGIRGTAYGATLEASGGDGTYSWALTSGGLPPGVALASNGTLAGTPTLAGTYGFTVQVTSGGLQASAGLSITVFDPLSVATTALSSAVLNIAYSASLQALGGDGSYTWSLASGTLPDGLSLDAAGVFSGTPTALGTSNFTVQVVSGDGQTATADLSITVNEQVLPPVVTTTTLPDGGVGAAYSAQLQATDGDGTYQWAVVTGALPAGLTLDAGTGAITGSPVSAGTSNFTVQVTSGGLTGSAALSIDVQAALSVATTSLPPGVEGAAYSADVTVTGGDGAPAFSIAAGALPAGLSLDGGTGTISGTPSPAPPPPVDGPQAVGTSNFTIEATNALGQTAQQALSISIFLPLSITTASLADGTVGVGYSQTLAASGGDGSLTWTVASGSLPAGLNLAAGTGVIGGTPTNGGTTSFTIQAVSGDGQVATANLSITIAFAPPTIGTTSLPDGVVGSMYTQSITVSGGDGSYAWAIVSGALPDGLSLGASNGLITGTPTTEGTANFTVEVTSAGMTASQALSITINAAAASCDLITPTSGYDIQLCYVTSVSTAVQTAFTNAVSRWQSLITGDVADVPPPENAHTSCVSGGGGPPLSGPAIDDLVIFVVVEPIDGEFGILGQAGPCFARNNWIPSVGTMRFDEADLDRLNTAGQLESVILHEMGHVLGSGTLWGPLSLLQEAATPGTSDPSAFDTWFSGPAATAAFDANGGSGRTGNKVPVANVGPAGSINGHWRESVFDFELMTPMLDSGVFNPLSAITVASLADLGYTVNTAGADAYTVQSPNAALRAEDTKVPMLDDILPIPLRVTDEQGRVIRVIPPGGGG